MIDIRSHFGFSATPFTREIPVEKRFSLPLFDEPLEALLRTVMDRMSAALIAPAGTGKTMLMRTLSSRLPEARYSVQYLRTAGLSRRDMCREIAVSIGCQPTAQYNTLLRGISERMIEQFDSMGTRPVIILDECHNMRPEVLATLSVLTNFEMDSRLVVSFIIVGQKQLARLLALDGLECIARRLACCTTLRNLSREETHQYVAHRQSIAGSRSDFFDEQAHDALFEIGGGNLRATDLLALSSLQIAASQGAKAVDATCVASARQRLWP